MKGSSKFQVGKTLPIAALLKARLPNTQTEIEWEEHEVKPNGDCGFTTLGTDRRTLAETLFLLKTDTKAREFLADEIANAFTTYVVTVGTPEEEGLKPYDPVIWKKLLDERDQAQKQLDELFQKVRHGLTEAAAKILPLDQLIAWLQQQNRSNEAQMLIDRRLSVFQAESAIQNHCQTLAVYDYYVRALRNSSSDKPLWLGYKSAMLFAQQKNITLYIWRKDIPNNPNQLVLMECFQGNGNGTNEIHMLHTHGFTHFNLLSKPLAQKIEQPLSDPLEIQKSPMKNTSNRKDYSKIGYSKLNEIIGSEVFNELESVDLHSNQLGKNEKILKGLVEHLSNKDCKLKWINLSFNDFEPAHIADLANALKNNNTIETILLQGNHIGNNGAKELANMLEKNGTLKALHLNGFFSPSVMQIAEEGINKLANALEKNTTLEQLNLWGHFLDENARPLLKMLEKNKTLLFLGLGRNNLSDNLAKEFATAIGKHPSLISVDLRFNRFDDDCMDKIAKALKNNTSLMALNVMNNGITTKGVNYLIDLLNEPTYKGKLVLVNLKAGDYRETIDPKAPKQRTKTSWELGKNAWDEFYHESGLWIGAKKVLEYAFQGNHNNVESETKKKLRDKLFKCFEDFCYNQKTTMLDDILKYENEEEYYNLSIFINSARGINDAVLRVILSYGERANSVIKAAKIIQSERKGNQTSALEETTVVLENVLNERDKLAANVNELVNALDKTQQELDTKINENLELQEEKQKHDLLVEQLRNKEKILQVCIGQLEQEKKDDQQTIQKLEKDKESLLNEINQLKAQITKQDAKITKLKISSDEKNTVINILMEKHKKESERQFSEFKNKIAKLKEKKQQDKPSIFPFFNKDNKENPKNSSDSLVQELKDSNISNQNNNNSKSMVD